VWSGNVQRAINEAAGRGIAVDVIGIGTSNGGVIPLPRDEKGVVLAGFEPIRSTIDRTSLREIARAGTANARDQDGARQRCAHHQNAALGPQPDGRIAR
jgi:hypothetical protein